LESGADPRAADAEMNRAYIDEVVRRPGTSMRSAALLRDTRRR
jgi:uncharacterized protein YecT (DUF1311 family)